MTADLQPDKPVAGWYKVRLVRGGPWVGVRVWFGPPLDPETGEELDRSPRWQAVQDGAFVDVWRLWPGCALHPIDEAEYAFRCARSEHAKRFAPHEPEASPTSAIDLNRLAPLF